MAAVADDNGNVKRLNNYHIRFEIEENGELVADKATFTNLPEIKWGVAPVWVRADTHSADVKEKASVALEGIHTPLSAEVTIKAVTPKHKIIADKEELSALLENKRRLKKACIDYETEKGRRTTG